MDHLLYSRDERLGSAHWALSDFLTDSGTPVIGHLPDLKTRREIIPQDGSILFTAMNEFSGKGGLQTGMTP
jgi:hypothetical protein